MRVWRMLPLKGATKLIIAFIITLLSLICGNQAVFAESSLSLSLSSEQISLDFTLGDFKTTAQTISASTTSPLGYVVNFATSGATTSLVEQNDNSVTIPTFTLPSGLDSIPAESISHGYGYSIDNGASYLPVPDPSAGSTKIFETFSSGTNDHILTYGAKTSDSDTAGTYSNTFTIFAVIKLEPCPANKICYFGNGNDGGVMDDQSASSNTETMLMAPNFSRSGYGFVSWNNEADGSGDNFGPHQTITTGDLSTTGLQLYAEWVSSSGDMQGWQGCEAMKQGDVIGLTDFRDNNTYAVTKYKDNKCWMMENLRLDLSKQSVKIDNLSTNNPKSSFADTINNTRPSSTNNFCTDRTQACIDQIKFNTNNTNRDLTASHSANNNSSSWYSYGNYYNWYTATAGHGDFALSTVGAEAGGDLCPAGWHLPTSTNASSDLFVLDKAMGGSGRNEPSGDSGSAASKRWRSYPLNYLYSGEQRGNAGYNRNTSSDYATKNSNGNDTNMNIWIRDAGVNFLTNGNRKERGQTIRCIYGGDLSININVHYDSNGGSGSMDDQENVNLASTVAADNTFTRDHYEFIKWNTKANGGGVTVQEGGSMAGAASAMNVAENGTLTLYAIWRPIYNVVYDGNGADAGDMSNINHLNPQGNITPYSPNFSRAGYGFAGWSFDPDAATKLMNGDDVKIYGPNGEVAFDDIKVNGDIDNVSTLYAVWIPADSNRTLQNFSSSECSALSVGDILALSDSRDNNTYTVAKLIDDNCWMVENLRLNPSTTNFSNANTNAPTSQFINEAPLSSTSNSLCNTNNNDACINSVTFNSDNINFNLVSSPIESNSESPRSWYSYGVYYNWYTATAGNGTFSVSSGNVAGDICPAGWRLPTGDTDGEYSTLYNALLDNSIYGYSVRSYPNNFIYSGDYNHETSGGRNSYARYWSSTAYDNNNAFRFSFTSYGSYINGGYRKWVAFPIRCIKKLN